MRPTDPRLLRQPAPRRGARWPGGRRAAWSTSVLVIGQAWLVAGLVVAVRRPPRRPALGAGRRCRSSQPAGWSGSLTERLRGTRRRPGRDRAYAVQVVRAVLVAVRRRATPQRGRDRGAATRGVARGRALPHPLPPGSRPGAVLPLLTVVVIATQDVLSAVIVLATLPAGAGLRRPGRARHPGPGRGAVAGDGLAVGPLPRRGARSADPGRLPARGGPVARRSARSPTATARPACATLRIAFASSAVLELVATLSVALVAVTVGVRLAAGHLDLHTALVVLLLAPEAYWPLRRVGAEFHAAAEGVATFEQVDELLAAPGPPTERWAPGGQRSPRRSTTSRSPTPAARARPRPRLDLAVRARASPRSPARPGAASPPCWPCSPACATPDAGRLLIDGARRRRRRLALPGGLAAAAAASSSPAASPTTCGSARPDADDDAVWAAPARVALEERVRQLPAGPRHAARRGRRDPLGRGARPAGAGPGRARRPPVGAARRADRPPRRRSPSRSSSTPSLELAPRPRRRRGRPPTGRGRRSPTTSCTCAAPRRVAGAGAAPASPPRPTARPSAPAGAPAGRRTRRRRGWSLPAPCWAALASAVRGGADRHRGLADRAGLEPARRAHPAGRDRAACAPSVWPGRCCGTPSGCARTTSPCAMLAERRVEVYDALVPLTPGPARPAPRRRAGLGRRRRRRVVDRELRVRMPVRGLRPGRAALAVGRRRRFLDRRAPSSIATSPASSAALAYVLARGRRRPQPSRRRRRAGPASPRASSRPPSSPRAA